MSTPRAEQLQDLFDVAMRLTAAEPPRDVAVSLGVDTTYISKLRSGWRPTRVRDDLWQRLQALVAKGGAPAVATAAQPPAFYDGVLYAAQAMAETQARLIAEARAGLATRFTPAEALAELDEAEELLDAAQRQLAAREAQQSRGRKRA